MQEVRMAFNGLPRSQTGLVSPTSRDTPGSVTSSTDEPTHTTTSCTIGKPSKPPACCSHSPPSGSSISAPALGLLRAHARRSPPQPCLRHRHEMGDGLLPARLMTLPPYDQPTAATGGAHARMASRTSAASSARPAVGVRCEGKSGAIACTSARHMCQK
jgi:hypothetical protein